VKSQTSLDLHLHRIAWAQRIDRGSDLRLVGFKLRPIRGRQDQRCQATSNKPLLVPEIFAFSAVTIG
jgi:hypothetical protein